MQGWNVKTYACTVCSYGYLPSKGDPQNNVPPGTAFEKLPEAWRCPWCKAPKSRFVEEGEEKFGGGEKECKRKREPA